MWFSLYRQIPGSTYLFCFLGNNQYYYPVIVVGEAEFLNN
jgi:hypothetical protein